MVGGGDGRRPLGSRSGVRLPPRGTTARVKAVNEGNDKIIEAAGIG
jgi:hypothetical protein